ncbi:NAD(P)/FAD-dependent oxidoreductase [Nocardioides sp. LS1]|uniref:NAD(P)/FAD-dependent oxidoreductase n=1 Tax=Nocardioides sp. LS1 TaxID=1027620 RepID=UPI000F61C9DB|nr:FAD-dependent oxidoreductase [Nocardioides sp. LS1]GCD89392.1 pyridine nucleotide-disulfide oxidoreductase [Nocardioides sp. LS1]
MTNRIVVVGGGLAAATAVHELRTTHGFTGPVTVLADEAHPPYERPPLSKAVLLGEKEATTAIVRPAEWYADHDVDLRTGTRAERIDRDTRTVHAAGEDIGYGQLLLATGARARRLPLVDDSGVPATYLRTIGDSVALRGLLRPGLRLGIIGGGWIGLEAAAAARTAGAEVTVLEALELPLVRVLGSEVAGIMTAMHREHGVDVRTSSQVTAVEATSDGTRLVLDHGDDLVVDHVLVGIGAQPNTELAEAAGLTVDNGIRTDAHLRTGDATVLAAGDVANVDHPLLGRPLRVEHWDTAIQHGKVAAATLAGVDAVADQQPYFFTDQYDFGMEYVGNAGPGDYDRVLVRGDTAGRVFTAWWLAGDRIVAGMHANDWDAIDEVRRRVGTTVDPAWLES